MINENHPFYGLANLLTRENATFAFSKYIYFADTVLDEREVITVDSSMLNKTWIINQLASLKKNQELAFHSTVRIDGRNYHIPMIDFSLNQDFNEHIYDLMGRYISKNILLNMQVYFSGRSFHAYSSSLLSPKEWIDFMGRLLLINPSNSAPIIDTRWIGHRLIGGYSSLRWSNNSEQYLSMPKRIKFP